MPLLWEGRGVLSEGGSLPPPPFYEHFSRKAPAFAPAFQGTLQLDQVIQVLLTTGMFVGGFLGFFFYSTIPEMSSPEAAKKRVLPAWMTKNVAEPGEWAKMKSKRRKKTTLARTETVYCMNEAELVDMALCILAENCKAIEGDVISSEDKVQEHQQELIDGHLPRTAVNIAKDPPIPSTPPDQSDQSASSSSSEETKLEEDDDSLKYVREIFFT